MEPWHISPPSSMPPQDYGSLSVVQATDASRVYQGTQRTSNDHACSSIQRDNLPQGGTICSSSPDASSRASDVSPFCNSASLKIGSRVSKHALGENRYGTISDTLFLLRPPVDTHAVKSKLNYSPRKWMLFKDSSDCFVYAGQTRVLGNCMAATRSQDLIP